MQQVAKGIWKMVLGKPEAYTPEYFRELSIKKDAIEHVSLSKRMAVEDHDKNKKGSNSNAPYGNG